jgi:predicted kinase
MLPVSLDSQFLIAFLALTFIQWNCFLKIPKEVIRSRLSKRRRSDNTMVKRKEEKDRQYNGQKKRREGQTIQWSKEKKRRTDNTMVK